MRAEPANFFALPQGPVCLDFPMTFRGIVSVKRIHLLGRHPVTKAPFILYFDRTAHASFVSTRWNPALPWTIHGGLVFGIIWA